MANLPPSGFRSNCSPLCTAVGFCSLSHSPMKTSKRAISIPKCNASFLCRKPSHCTHGTACTTSATFNWCQKAFKTTTRKKLPWRSPSPSLFPNTKSADPSREPLKFLQVPRQSTTSRFRKPLPLLKRLKNADQNPKLPPRLPPPPLNVKSLAQNRRRPHQLSFRPSLKNADPNPRPPLRFPLLPLPKGGANHALRKFNPL